MRGQDTGKMQTRNVGRTHQLREVGRFCSMMLPGDLYIPGGEFTGFLKHLNCTAEPSGGDLIMKGSLPRRDWGKVHQHS